MSVYKDSGVRLPVLMRDGKPICAHCGEPMVQPDPERPDLWKCGYYAELEARLIPDLARAVGRLLDGDSSLSEGS